MTFSIMTLNIMTISVMTISIMTLSIMTLRIMTLSKKHNKKGTLRVNSSCYAECHVFIIMLSVVMLNVTMLSVRRQIERNKVLIILCVDKNAII